MGENEKKDDLFRFVEYSAEEAERTGYSDYSYWKSVFQNFRMVNIGSEQITSDVITGARYGMQHRHPLSWR